MIRKPWQRIVFGISLSFWLLLWTIWPPQVSGGAGRLVVDTSRLTGAQATTGAVCPTLSTAIAEVGFRAIADRIQPRYIILFHGAIDMKQLRPLEKLVIKIVKPPVGDFRDWCAITSWAQTIVAAVKGEPQ